MRQIIHFYFFPFFQVLVNKSYIKFFFCYFIFNNNRKIPMRCFIHFYYFSYYMWILIF